MPIPSNRFDLRDVRFQRVQDLRHDDDDERMRDAIDWLVKSNIPTCRTSAVQLKIGPLSFYPKTGTLNFDNQPRLPDCGLAGLKAVLEQATGVRFPPI